MKIKEWVKHLTKRELWWGVGVICLLLGVLFLGLWAKKGEQETKELTRLTTPTPTPHFVVGINEPTVELVVYPDRSGATLIVGQIPKNFVRLEYEVIYLAGGPGREIERGVAGGPIDIPPSQKVKEEILFGTESCTTGVCRRHIDKNVSGGTLSIRLFTEKGEVWGKEYHFKIEKGKKGYQAVLTPKETSQE